MPKPLSYKSAGVDREAAGKAKHRIKIIARTTFNKDVLTGIGAFGAFYRFHQPTLKDPVLVSSVDGVGTKLKIAHLMNRYDTVAEDLVNHCADDILVHGARPLYFLDYLAFGKLRSPMVESIVKGFARGCKTVGCALIGGETAEMPDVYTPPEFDVAGCIVGVVDRKNIIDGSHIQSGNLIIGLAAKGLHTNGYTLARKILFERCRYRVSTHLPILKTTVGKALLAPHPAYGPSVFPLLSKGWVRGMAHITGGGLLENIPRVLPKGTMAVIQRGTWPVLPIFRLLQEKGRLEARESHTTFNMGVGYVVMVRPQDEGNTLDYLRNKRLPAWTIGSIGKTSSSTPHVALA